MNQELEDFKKILVKKARMQAMVFGILAVIALITLVYAFFQQSAANRSRVQAEQNLELARQAQTEVYDLKIKLEKATIEAMMAKAVAEDCGNSKTKK